MRNRSAQAAKMTEIESNLRRFVTLLPSMIPEHEGQSVLLRRGEVHGYFRSLVEAQIAGNSRFPDKVFSVQEVTEQVEELGRYTYAIASRSA